MPPNILGRFSIICATLRQLHLILQIRYFPLTTPELPRLQPDVFFVDQLSAGLPLLRLADPHARVFFYCHFPDLLLAQGRDRFWKRLYRLPFDALERWTMGLSHAIAVNSNFTRSIVAATWPSLARDRDLLTVYPCVDVNVELPEEEERGRKGRRSKKEKREGDGGGDDSEPPWGGKPFLLSINRFERKKDVALAIRAFAGLPADRRRDTRLVVAGGYDSRVSENVACHRELEALAAELGLRSRTAGAMTTALIDTADEQGEAPDVVFLLSVPSKLKELLLRHTRLLIYTPANEHFGIVPLEGMLRGAPVLAADTGGPVETVVDGVTGWLRDPSDPPAWTAVMNTVLNDLSPAGRAAMGRAGAHRVREGFGQENMAERLDAVLDDLVAAAPAPGANAAVEIWSGIAFVALGTMLWGFFVAGAMFWVFGSQAQGAGDAEGVVWAER